eukprot:TRINITY_DN335_c0_g2_i1.p1 TRINITY_DN335_c0_g2~~TRINITY_DN335_c0_g2_i1.p1  ORF type:complete len:332 (+),score=75.29 TRINITY_DN335_c0_g2_i1:166-1161(+)
MAVCEVPTAWEEEQVVQPPSSNYDWARIIGTPHCPVEVASAIQAYKISSLLGDMHELTGSDFEVQGLPRQSLGDYAQRLLRGLLLEPHSWLCAIVLISRCGVRINSRSAHLLLLTALTVADKMLADGCYRNVSYARVGRVPLKVLNRLERKFLRLLDYNASVSPADLDTLVKELRELNTEEKLQEFYSAHERNHLEYLRTKQQRDPAQDARADQPQLQSPQLCIDTDVRSDPPSSEPTPNPEVPQTAACSVRARSFPPMGSARVPTPPASARPSGARRCSDVNFSSECAAGAPGTRRGFARSRADRVPRPPVPVLKPSNSAVESIARDAFL